MRKLFKKYKPETLRKVFESNILRHTMPPVLFDSFKDKKIMVLAPHQDDGIIGAGGLLLKSSGIIQCVYLTNGTIREKPKLANVRRDEAYKVWEEFSKPYFIDNYIREIDIKKSVEELRVYLKVFEPDVILLPFFLQPHPDHQKTCEIFAEAVKDYKNIEVWSYQTMTISSPNVIVDITEVVEEKKRLNGLWKSQNKQLDYVRWTEARDITNSIYLKKDGTDKSAELFLRLNLKDYLTI